MNLTQAAEHDSDWYQAPESDRAESDEDRSLSLTDESRPWHPLHPRF